MSTAKKGKKSKGKTVALMDFLQDTPGAMPAMPIRKSTMNWADEVEDNHDIYDSRSSKTSVVLPTAPKSSRDVEDINDKVPQDPPYIAYLSNLPYDVDEEEISLFFKNMKISNMRIPKDERSGEMPKLKGFGYVEFEDRDSLLQALVIPDTTIKGRRIRIEVSTDYDNDKRRGGRMDMNRDRRPESSMGDWRSGPRQEGSSEPSERRGGFGGRDRERDRDRDENISGAWREGGRPSRDSDRSGGGGGFTRGDRDSDRSGGGFTRGDRDSDRSGGGFTRSDRDTDRGNITRSTNNFDRDGGGGSDFGRRGGERDDKGGGGFMSRRFEDRGGGRDFGRRDRDEGGGGGRDFGRRGGEREEGGMTRGPARERDPPAAARGDEEAGRQRPKLVLAPRSKPVEEGREGEQPEGEEREKVAVVAAAAGGSHGGASIFGNAKPVDTSARERQIEERLAKDSEAPLRRDGSRERRDDREQKEKRDDRESSKEKVDKDKEIEKPIERARSATPTETEDNHNGVVEKSQHAKRNGEERRDSVESKPKVDIKKREEKKEKVEKEMPKLKKVEAPNFIANNKYAFLETEDSD